MCVEKGLCGIGNIGCSIQRLLWEDKLGCTYTLGCELSFLVLLSFFQTEGTVPKMAIAKKCSEDRLLNQKTMKGAEKADHCKTSHQRAAF